MIRLVYYCLGLYPSIQFRLPFTPPPPPSIFYGCQIVHLDPLDVKRMCPQIKFGMAYWKMHSFHDNPGGFEKGGMPTKVLLSQLLLILDY